MSGRDVSPRIVTGSAKARTTGTEAPDTIAGNVGHQKDRTTPAGPVSRPLTPEQVRRACATYYSQDAADATVAHMRRLEGLINYYNQCGDVTALSGPIETDARKGPSGPSNRPSGLSCLPKLV